MFGVCLRLESNDMKEMKEMKHDSRISCEAQMSSSRYSSEGQIRKGNLNLFELFELIFDANNRQSMTMNPLNLSRAFILRFSRL